MKTVTARPAALDRSCITPGPVLETLEARLAPAGTIVLTTAGGVLTITGDGADNGIEILDVPATGEWKINNGGALMTTFIFNGAPLAAGANIPAQNAIKVNLLDGNDILEILPSAAPSSMEIFGGLSANMGKGDDQVFIGTSSAQHLQIGAISVDLGEGNDLFDTTLSGVYSGLVKVVGGLGNDIVNVEAATGDQVFLKGLAIDLGKGDNELLINAVRTAITGALSITDAGEAGTSPLINIHANTLTVDGAVSMVLGAGNASVSFGNNTTDIQQFGAGLKIVAGAGNDTVAFLGTQTFVGGVAVDLKEGANATVLDMNTLFRAASLSVVGGSGTDTFRLEDNSSVVVNAGLSVNLGHGSNTWDADPGSVLTAGSLTYAGGTGAETVKLLGGSVTVLGAATFSLGADGVSDLQISPTTGAYFGGLLTVNGGKGADTVAFNSPDIWINTGLKFALGEGANTVNFEGARLQVAGGITYAGGSGNDALTINTDSLVVARAVVFNGGSAGSNSLYFSGITGSIGSVSYTGGASSDILALGYILATSTTRMTVNGAVTASMGAGTGSVVVVDSFIQGALNVTTASKTGESDAFIVRESTLKGAVNVNLGAGTSTTTLRDVIARGAFTLNTGAGNDVVNMETVADTIESQWFGLVKINLGAGMDTISIGTNPVVANAANNFYKNVTVDGGADSDTFLVGQPGSNTYHGLTTLTQLNFP